MIIGSYAIGAHEGYVYVRAEYPLAVKRLTKAVADAEARGYLGKDVFGSGWEFNVHLKLGAGAFVCGEETALIASIEGKRGMPRTRPPFPAVSGLWGKPTNINNVETFSNIPWIIANGAEAYAALGVESCRGTKAFSLAGKVVNGGLVEVPMGTSLRHLIFDVGGGIKDGKQFKAVQLGGPSGGCVPASLLDTPVDYESLAATGAIVGSGGMVVVDDETCMVDLARFFLDFTQKESCGKCVPCRLGTKRMLETLDRIIAGDGREGDIEMLEELGHYIIDGTLCALGGTAPNPVLTTIKYFRDEYEAHIREKRCPAGKCKSLITYYIDPDDLHRLHAVRQEVPDDLHQRREEAAPRHRRGQLHQVRHLPPGLQVRRRQGALGDRAARGDRSGSVRGRWPPPSTISLARRRDPTRSSSPSMARTSPATTATRSSKPRSASASTSRRCATSRGCRPPPPAACVSSRSRARARWCPAARRPLPTAWSCAPTPTRCAPCATSTSNCCLATTTPSARRRAATPARRTSRSLSSSTTSRTRTTRTACASCARTCRSRPCSGASARARARDPAAGSSWSTRSPSASSTASWPIRPSTRSRRASCCCRSSPRPTPASASPSWAAGPPASPPPSTRASRATP